MMRLLSWWRRVSRPRDAEIERRLVACELHFQDLEERIGPLVSAYGERAAAINRLKGM